MYHIIDEFTFICKNRHVLICLSWPKKSSQTTIAYFYKPAYPGSNFKVIFYYKLKTIISNIDSYKRLREERWKQPM